MNALSVGFPGREKSNVILCLYAHKSMSRLTNSLPLSTLIGLGTTDPFTDFVELAKHIFTFVAEPGINDRREP